MIGPPRQLGFLPSDLASAPISLVDAVASRSPLISSLTGFLLPVSRLISKGELPQASLHFFLFCSSSPFAMEIHYSYRPSSTEGQGFTTCSLLPLSPPPSSCTFSSRRGRASASLSRSSSLPTSKKNESSSFRPLDPSGLSPLFSRCPEDSGQA